MIDAGTLDVGVGQTVHPVGQTASVICGRCHCSRLSPPLSLSAPTSPGSLSRQVERPIDTFSPGGDTASAFILAHLRLPAAGDRVLGTQLVEA